MIEILVLLIEINYSQNFFRRNSSIQFHRTINILTVVILMSGGNFGKRSKIKFLNPQNQHLTQSLIIIMSKNLKSMFVPL